MVRALDVDRPAVPPPPLVHVVRDVREEVRVVATARRAAPHDAVLVVAELGRPEKESAVLLVRVARRDERTDRRVDFAVRVERALEEILSELDPDRRQVKVRPLPEARTAKPTHGVVITAFGSSG